MFKVVKLKFVNPDQEYFGRLFAEARWWYNYILSFESLGDFDTKQKSCTVHRGENVDIENINFLSSQMRQQIYRKIYDNIKGLSASKKNGRKIGKLKFKSVVNSIPLSNQTFKISNGKVKLQSRKKLVKIRGLSQLPEKYNIRCASIVRKPSGVYLHVTIKVENVAEIKDKKAIGVDLGIKDCLTFNDGTKVNYRVNLSKLKRLHQDLSRKTKGSKRYEKTRILLKKEYERLSNKKEDAANKINNKLKNYKVYYQDEMIASWQKFNFGKAVSSGILGRVKSRLKQNPDNHELKRSEPTTQLCPKCSSLNKTPLDIRVYTCKCGHSCDRDIHSANNMIFIGSERANVEKELDLYSVFSEIKCKHLSVKREALPL